MDVTPSTRPTSIGSFSPRGLLRRTLPVAGAVALVIGVASGCSTVGTDAARVGDERLSNKSFEDLVQAYTLATGSGKLPIGNIDAEAARVVLLDWIATSALEQTLSEYGVVVSEEDLAAAEESLADQSGFAEAPRKLRDFYIRATAVRTLTGTTFSPSPEELSDLYTAGPEESGLVCLRFILTDSREELDAALARIEAGEAFADVATDVSTDPSASTGGILANDQTGGGCFPFTQIVQDILEPIARAIPQTRPGEVSEPIEVPDLGWIAITQRPYAEVAEDTRDLIGPVTAAKLSDSALDSATVWVNPEYGRWDPESKRITVTS